MVYCPSAGSLNRSRRPVAKDRRAIDVPSGSSSPTKAGVPALVKRIDSVSPCLPPNSQWLSPLVSWPWTVCPYSITLSAGGAVCGWQAATSSAHRIIDSQQYRLLERVWKFNLPHPVSLRSPPLSASGEGHGVRRMLD